MRSVINLFAAITYLALLMTNVVLASEKNSLEHNFSARFSHTATLLKNGKVLIVGGSGKPFIGGVDTEELLGAALASADLYDPTKGIWLVTSSLSVPRIEHTTTLLANGKVLVAGGSSEISGKELGSAELYDPVTDIWSITGDLVTPRVYHTATLLTNGKVLVVGGSDGVGIKYASAEIYDPVTGTWSKTGDLNAPRAYHTATLLANGKVLVVGYGTTGKTSTSELYDPTTGKWTQTGNLVFPHGVHTATMLTNGMVLVAGGCITEHDTVKVSAKVEIYDPSTNSWSEAASLKYARCSNTATLLPNGNVLITGGNIGVRQSATVELYDPSAKTWTVAENILSKRSHHTATLLPNGKVLIAGGGVSNSDKFEALPSTQLYDPSKLIFRN